MKTKLALALAAGLIATAATAADLKICVEGAYPPFSELTPSGELVGFDIDIATALCAKIGKSCEMSKTEWDGIIPALMEGKCDAIVASMSITEERKKQIDFTGKYYQTPAKFVGKADAGLVDTVEGLKGKVVGVQRGTIHQAFMEGEFPGVELKLYGSQDEVYLDLAAGRVDAIIQDSVAADEGFLKQDAGKGFAFFGKDYAIPKYHGDGAGIGVRKEDAALRDQLTAAIKSLRDSGEYKAINDKYFAFDLYGG